MTDRPYWDMDVEPHLDTERMREAQLKALQARVTELYEKAPYWRKRMRDRGAEPGDLRQLSDWPLMIPPFTKRDQLELVEAYGYDYERVWADMLPVPLERIRLIGATSGTTGDPTPSPHTFTTGGASDGGRAHARMFWRAGVRPGDRWLHAFALSMFNAGLPMVLSVMEFGAAVIPVGAEAGSERILRFIELLKPRVLACTPSLASYLIERAPEVLSKPMTDLGIEILICGGEPGAGVPEIRARLERGYGARLFDLGGGPGISCDHEEYQGMHFVADDLMLYELFDPATGEPIELKDGAEGEQALTSLVPGAGGRGFVRLTFGDMHRVEKSQCPCGRTGFRYRIIGRSDDMLKVKGVIVYPAAVAGVISQFEPRVTGQFRIVLESPPPLVTPPLRLTVERGFNTSIDQLDELAKEMAGAMHSRLRVRPTIDWVDPGSLGRESHKTQLLDKRYGSRT